MTTMMPAKMRAVTANESRISGGKGYLQVPVCHGEGLQWGGEIDAKVIAGKFSTRSEAVVYYLTAEMVREEQLEVDREKFRQDITDSVSKEIAKELIVEQVRKQE